MTARSVFSRPKTETRLSSGGLRRTVRWPLTNALAGEWFTVVMGRRIVGLARTGSLPSGRDAALIRRHFAQLIIAI